MSHPLSIFRLPDFRRLFAGVTTSQLGDQFALIATPWLVMQLTGDPLALGIVLALEGIPRAGFMLVGGAVTDRFSPRMVMFLSDIIRLILTTLIAIAILSGTVEMWMVYVFALGFGLVAGFAMPAGNSILPTLVGEEDLQTGNALVMGGGQLMAFVGPFAAGILIGHFTDGLTGVGLAFALDALTFGVSGLMLWRMTGGGELSLDRNEGAGEALWAEVLAGLAYVWHTGALRVIFLIIAALNLLFVGPIMVGIPVLAAQKLAEGALAFGILMSGFAIGNLVGFVLAGVLPAPRPVAMRRILMATLAVVVAVLLVLGTVANTWVILGVLSGFGLLNGFITIVLISNIQKRVPKDVLGRVMGLFSFAGIGLVPVSQAVSGVVCRWDVEGLFIESAALTAVFIVWIFSRSMLTMISADVAAEPG